MLVSLKALPWLFPFLRELFKRGVRQPTAARRLQSQRQSPLFLVTGFFIVIVIITIFAGEKIIALMMENNGLKQENLTLKYARNTNQELINQLNASNEQRGRHIDAIEEQNKLLLQELGLVARQVSALEELAKEKLGYVKDPPTKEPPEPVPKKKK